jgi:hypothetical protein
MRRHWSAAAAVAVSLALAACGKGDRKVCEQACRNYTTLAFWDKWDAQIDAQPAAERDKLRRDKLGELEVILARGIDMCVTSCQTANNETQYACMATAKTWAEANACAPTEAED